MVVTFKKLADVPMDVVGSQVLSLLSPKETLAFENSSKYFKQLVTGNYFFTTKWGNIIIEYNFLHLIN